MGRDILKGFFIGFLLNAIGMIPLVIYICNLAWNK